MFSEKLLELLKSFTDVCSVFDSFEKGDVLLPYGATEFFIKTRKDPVEVYFSFIDGDMPVCYGNVSMIGYSIVPGGFVIHPKVEANSLQVKYFVFF